MIKSVRIQNYKSIHDLTLELGRFNVLIGANGSGKSNILEAIAFGAAADENRLDSDILHTKGIRVTTASRMAACFPDSKSQNPISISVTTKENKTIKAELKYQGKPYGQWINLVFENSKRELIGLIEDNAPDFDPFALNSLVSNLLKNKHSNGSYEKFVIFSLENTYLRNFETEIFDQPLGSRGEGLFSLVSNLTKKEKENLITFLKIFDWFESFKQSTNPITNERVLVLYDKYLSGGNENKFDQRSANEGFLFLLFYFTLFISKYTPPFFAIDNIDATLNPKLCANLIHNLTKLASDKNKQAIVTTHNPAVLDGLNLQDPEQRLFVVQRNLDGHTYTRQVKPEKVANLSVSLSEAWMRGYLGGLPDNF